MMEPIKNFKDYIESINEGLIKTYPGEVVIKDIITSLDIYGLDISSFLKGEKLHLKIDNFHSISLYKIRDIFDIIDSSVVNRGGWFPSTMKIVKTGGFENKMKYDFFTIINIHNEIQYVEIIYECKYDIFDFNVPDKLYHLSIKEYSKKINKFGLSPRSKSKLSSHVDRIYLCKEYKDCVNLIGDMMMFYSGEKDENIYKLGKKFFSKDITPIIYEIDNSDGFIDKLYKDPNYDNGYYTLENIHKNKLKII